MSHDWSYNSITSDKDLTSDLSHCHPWIASIYTHILVSIKTVWTLILISNSWCNVKVLIWCHCSYKYSNYNPKTWKNLMWFTWTNSVHIRDVSSIRGMTCSEFFWVLKQPKQFLNEPNRKTMKNILFLFCLTNKQSKFIPNIQAAVALRSLRNFFLEL